MALKTLIASEIRIYHNDQFIGQISCLDFDCEKVVIYGFNSDSNQLSRLASINIDDLMQNLEKTKFRPALREFSYHFSKGNLFVDNLSKHRRVLEGIALAIDLGNDLYQIPLEYKRKKSVYLKLKESLLEFNENLKQSTKRIIELQVSSKIETNIVTSFLGVLSGEYSYASCNQLMLKKLLKLSSDF